MGARRYGGYAMEVLINELIKLGARKKQLQAKAFGGACVLTNASSFNIGARNAQFVLEFLATEGIPLIAQDLEDVVARKVLFYPRSGRALVKRLAGAANTHVITSEIAYSADIEQRSSSGRSRCSSDRAVLVIE